MLQTSGGFELVLTVTLVIQANQLAKYTNHPNFHPRNEMHSPLPPLLPLCLYIE